MALVGTLVKHHMLEFTTSLLGFIICFFVLARKSLNKMQVIMQEGMSEIEKAQGSQDPNHQSEQLEKAISIMTQA